MIDCSQYAVTVTFHGITYYGSVKSDMGPNEFLKHIAETGDIGDGFKFAFPGEPEYQG